MIIRKTKSHYTLSRYGGVSNGKNLEVRIGVVPLGISPQDVAADIVEDLTPKQLKQLQEKLAADQKQILAGKVACLTADLNDLTSAVESRVLTLDDLVDLHKAATHFVKRFRSLIPKIAATNSPREPS